MLDAEMLSALYQLPPRLVNNALGASRIYMNRRIVADDPSQFVFRSGWDARAISFYVPETI